jgi:VanZ family protein
MSRALHVLFAWLPSASYMAVIWVLSSSPLPITLDDFPLKDKAAHFLEYAVLGLLNAYALSRTFAGLATGRALAYAALLTATFGWIDEMHQAFVPGRNADTLDVLADALGAIAGALVFSALARRLRRGAEPPPVTR